MQPRQHRDKKITRGASYSISKMSDVDKLKYSFDLSQATDLPKEENKNLVSSSSSVDTSSDKSFARSKRTVGSSISSTSSLFSTQVMPSFSPEPSLEDHSATESIAKRTTESPPPQITTTTSPAEFFRSLLPKSKSHDTSFAHSVISPSRSPRPTKETSQEHALLMFSNRIDKTHPKSRAQYDAAVQRRIRNRLKRDLRNTLSDYDRWSLEALNDFTPLMDPNPPSLKQSAKLAKQIKVQALQDMLREILQNE